MKHLTGAAISLLLVAVGLAGCVEDQAAATPAKAVAVRRADAHGQAGTCSTMAAGTCSMDPATAVWATAIRPVQACPPEGKVLAIRAISVGPGAIGRPAVAAGAVRLPFGATGPRAPQMYSQVATGQLAVARIESLAMRKDSPVDGIELLMRIAGSDAPAPVRRSAVFAVSRLHERAGNLEKAAQILARVALLPDDPRPAGPPPFGRVGAPLRPEQLPPDIREAAERLENRRRELDELTHELQQRRREVEAMAQRLRQAEPQDD